MRIYLHIGTHKTGTTAIQWSLAHGAESLATAGVVYPDAGRLPRPHGTAVGHHGLAWAFTRRRETGDPWPDLMRELESSAEPKAVISSEEFWALRKGTHFSALRERLAGHDVTVIVYLRRQDELLHASFCTAVLTQHETRPFDEYRRNTGLALDYGRRLAAWERAFGREALIVRPYERSRLLEGDSVQDFLAQLDLSAIADLQRSPMALVNRSYPRSVVESVRRLRVAGADEEAISDLIEVCRHVYGDRPTDADILPPKRRAALLERFRDSNEHVARHFLGKENGRLFDDLGVGDEAAWIERYRGAQAEVTALIDDTNRALAAR